MLFLFHFNKNFALKLNKIFSYVTDLYSAITWQSSKKSVAIKYAKRMNDKKTIHFKSLVY